MFQTVALIFSVISIIVSFFAPLWSWIILGIPILFLFFIVNTLKRKEWERIPGLSELANNLFQKHGHYYLMPLASIDYSNAARIFFWVSIVIALIVLFNKFWLGLAFGLLVTHLMPSTSKDLNPTRFFCKPEEMNAHNEIISYLSSKRKMGKTFKVID